MVVASPQNDGSDECSGLGRIFLRWRFVLTGSTKSARSKSTAPRFKLPVWNSAYRIFSLPVLPPRSPPRRMAAKLFAVLSVAWQSVLQLSPASIGPQHAVVSASSVQYLMHHSTFARMPESEPTCRLPSHLVGRVRELVRLRAHGTRGARACRSAGNRRPLHTPCSCRRTCRLHPQSSIR